MTPTHPPPPHHDGCAVITVLRDSDLHRDPTVIGLVVQRAWVEYPELPVVIAVVNEVVWDLEVRGE